MLWEQLRPKQTTKEEKAQLVSNILSKVTGAAAAAWHSSRPAQCSFSLVFATHAKQVTLPVPLLPPCIGQANDVMQQ